jgi:hypothetical protein
MREEQYENLVKIELKHPVEFEEKSDGSIVGPWRKVRWHALSEHTADIIALICALQPVLESAIQIEDYQRRARNLMHMGFHICSNAAVKVDLALINAGIQEFYSQALRNNNNPNQSEMFASPLIDGEARQTVQRVVRTILSRKGDQSLKTQVLISNSQFKIECAGTYAPKPAVEITKPAMLKITGTVDTLSYSGRRVEILGARKSRLVVLIDVRMFFPSLRARLGDQRLYEFSVMEENDAKGQKVLTLKKIHGEIEMGIELETA